MIVAVKLEKSIWRLKMKFLEGLIRFFRRYELESAAVAFAEAGEIEIAREFLKEAKGNREPERKSEIVYRKARIRHGQPVFSGRR